MKADTKVCVVSLRRICILNQSYCLALTLMYLPCLGLKMKCYSFFVFSLYFICGFPCSRRIILSVLKRDHSFPSGVPPFSGLVESLQRCNVLFCILKITDWNITFLMLKLFGTWNCLSLTGFGLREERVGVARLYHTWISYIFGFRFYEKHSVHWAEKSIIHCITRCRV